MANKQRLRKGQKETPAASPILTINGEETKLNTIFEQDGKVYAICSHHVPAKDLAWFIRHELVYGSKHIPRFQMRTVTTEEFRKMAFGAPQETKSQKGGER